MSRALTGVGPACAGSEAMGLTATPYLVESYAMLSNDSSIEVPVCIVLIITA